MSYNHQDRNFLHTQSILPLLFLLYQNFYIFLLCILSGVRTYSSKASFERIESLTKIVSSSRKLAKSNENGSFPKNFLITSIFLFHLSLRLPGYFEAAIQSFSRVLRAFQAVLLENVSHFNTKLQNFLKPEASSDFAEGNAFISFLYDASK